MSSYSLPNNPIKEVHRCLKCGRIKVYFLNSKFDRTFAPEVWDDIIKEGFNSLRKQVNFDMKQLESDPKFFT